VAPGIRLSKNFRQSSLRPKRKTLKLMRMTPKGLNGWFDEDQFTALEAELLLSEHRNRSVHFGDVSDLAKLRESQRALSANLEALDAALLNELAQPKDTYFIGFSGTGKSGLLRRLITQSTVGTVRAAFQTSATKTLDELCFQWIDFGGDIDFEKEAERIRREYPAILAARLVALLRLTLARKHFERLLRAVSRTIAVIVRLIRTREFISSLIVRQAAFFHIHGEHPPRESALVALGPVFRAGGCAA